MINSQVLSIVIGLVFIYLIYSLLTTILMELLASLFSFRAKILERGIYRMLQDDCQFPNRYRSIILLFLPFRSTLNDPQNWFGRQLKKLQRWITCAEKYDNAQQDFIVKFYGHPNVKYLSEGAYRNKPAYLRKETFSKVIIDLLRGTEVKAGDDIRSVIEESLENKVIKWKNLDEPDNNSGELENSKATFQYLSSIWVDAQGDLDKFKTYLEEWFDETMERASGWYKKNTQFLLFFLGVVVAGAFNVNTIKIVKKLEEDPALRAQLITQAERFLEANQERLKQVNGGPSDSLLQWTYDLYDNHIYDLNNGLSLAREKQPIDESSTRWKRFRVKTGQCIGHIFWSLPGWLLTALAISLGAPFWFDLLNKLMQLRTSLARKQQETAQPANRSASPRQVSNIKRKG